MKVRSTGGPTGLGRLVVFVLRGALLLLFASGTVSQGHAADPWGLRAGLGLDGRVLQAVVQSDGKLILAGDFTRAGGQSVPGLVRVLPDGGVDGSFRPFEHVIHNISDNWLLRHFLPHGACTQLQITTTAVALTPDGQLRVGGQCGSHGFLVGMTTTGAPDSSFQLAMPHSSHGRVAALSVTPDGEYLLVGGQRLDGPMSGGNLAARPAGVPAPVANRTLLVLPLKHVGPLHGGVGRVQASNDAVVIQNGQVQAFAWDDQARLWVGGDFQRVNGAAHRGLVRLLRSASGEFSLDPAVRVRTDGRVRAILPLPNGRVLIGGAFSRVYDDVRGLDLERDKLALLSHQGALIPGFDMTFTAPGASLGVSSLTLQPNGGVLVTGGFDTVRDRFRDEDPVESTRLFRLEVNGQQLRLDHGFRNPYIDMQALDVLAGVGQVGMGPNDFAVFGQFQDVDGQRFAANLFSLALHADDVPDDTRLVVPPGTPFSNHWLSGADEPGRSLPSLDLPTDDHALEDAFRRRMAHATAVWHGGAVSLPDRSSPLPEMQRSPDWKPSAEFAHPGALARWLGVPRGYPNTSARTALANGHYVPDSCHWNWRDEYTDADSHARGARWSMQSHPEGSQYPLYLPDAWDWDAWHDYREKSWFSPGEPCLWQRRFVRSRWTQGLFGPTRYNPDPSLPAFKSVDGVVNDAWIDESGRTYLAGTFRRVQGTPVAQGLIRLKEDGTLDRTFQPPIGGNFTRVRGYAARPALAEWGMPAHRRLLVVTEQGRLYALKLDSQRADDGSELDATFIAHMDPLLDLFIVNDFDIDANGWVYVVGRSRLATPNRSANRGNLLYRLGFDGRVDSRFQAWIPSGDLRAVAVAPAGGRIFVGGAFLTTVNEQASRRNLACFESDGRLCGNFVASVLGGHNYPVQTLAIARRGNVQYLVIGGDFTELSVSGSLNRETPRLAVLRMAGINAAPVAITQIPRIDGGSQPRVMRVRADGDRIYAGGAFDEVGDRPFSNLVRLEIAPDGRALRVDDFASPGIAMTQAGGDRAEVRAIALDPRDETQGLPDSRLLVPNVAQYRHIERYTKHPACALQSDDKPFPDNIGELIWKACRTWRDHYVPESWRIWGSTVKLLEDPERYLDEEGDTARFTSYPISLLRSHVPVPLQRVVERHSRVVAAGRFDRVGGAPQSGSVRLDRCGQPERLSPGTMGLDAGNPLHEFPLTLHMPPDRQTELLFSYEVTRDLPEYLVAHRRGWMAQLRRQEPANARLVLPRQLGPWAVLCPGALPAGGIDRRFWNEFVVVPMWTQSGGLRTTVWLRQQWEAVITAYLGAVYSLEPMFEGVSNLCGADADAVHFLSPAGNLCPQGIDTAGAGDFAIASPQWFAAQMASGVLDGTPVGLGMGLAAGTSAYRNFPWVQYNLLGTGQDLNSGEGQQRYLMALAAFSAASVAMNALSSPSVADVREALSGVPSASAFWSHPEVLAWERHVESVRAAWPAEALPAFP